MRASPYRGHSLLEAILAAMIFSSVAIFLMGVWEMQFKAMSKSKETGVAAFLAERVMEECIAAGFVYAPSLYPEPVQLQVRARTKAGEKVTNYEASVTVVNHPTDSEQRLVSVTVTYTDSTGQSSVSYHSAIHRNQ